MFVSLDESECVNCGVIEVMTEYSTKCVDKYLRG